MNKKNNAKNTKSVSAFVQVAKRSKKQRIIFIIFTVLIGAGLIGSSMMWAFGPSKQEQYSDSGATLAMAAEEKITDLENQLKSDPQNISVLEQLAPLYWQKNDAEKAIDTYQKVLAIKPADMKTSKELALIYYLVGEYGNAVASLEQAIEKNNQDPQAYYYLGQFYAYRSDDGKNIDKGIAALEKFVQMQKEGTDVQKAQQMIDDLKSRL